MPMRENALRDLDLPAGIEGLEDRRH
jgi:hypothetical protein